MRALIALSVAALLLPGCETAFVGRAPAGRYELVEVNGRAVPHERRTAAGCSATVESGHFDLDALARRFELALRERGECWGGNVHESRENGTYLRRGGRLTLEALDAEGRRRTWIASESGDAVALEHQGMRLRFRQTERQRP
jgi:hypothetical protein